MRARGLPDNAEASDAWYHGHDSHFVLLCLGLYPYNDIGGPKTYSLACPETVELQRTTKHTVMVVLHLG